MIRVGVIQFDTLTDEGNNPINYFHVYFITSQEKKLKISLNEEEYNSFNVAIKLKNRREK